MDGSVLNSWKDIAAHLHTSVRTAQRWEMHFGLPIHRPSGTHKGPVLAFVKELDGWIQNSSAKETNGTNGMMASAAVDSHHEYGAQVVPEAMAPSQQATRTRELSREIRLKTQMLKAQLEKALASRPKIDPILGPPPQRTSFHSSG
jgi:hypothetical protein